MIKCRNIVSLAAACGAAFGLASAAAAQPVVINISGATLLENFFRSRASTVDYIDADGNGVARSYPTSTNQQLAPFGLPDPFPNNQNWPSNMRWAVMYSAVGSTNGFQELINHGRGFVTTDALDNNGLPQSRRTAAYYNRYRYLLAGTANDDTAPEFPPQIGLIINRANPMAAPIRSQTTFIDWPANTIPNPNAFRALYTSGGDPGVASTAPNEGLTAVGGLTVDIAPLDVPTTYAVTQPGDPSPSRRPLQPGYGNNPRLAVNKDGTVTTRGNRLATLTGGANLFTPGVTPNSNTIFDSSILFAPVAPVVNFGVNMSQMDMSDLNHLFSSGRRINGENLVAVTRDSGSGTRNAFDNSRGIDPSWAYGENVGLQNNAPQFDALGAAYLPSNKAGNNRVEPSVINHRLAIGYVGPERGVEQAWLTGGQMEVLAIRADIAPYNRSAYVRPTIHNVLDNDGPDAWVIGGPSVLATFGDPMSAPPEKGGLGWMEPYTDLNGNGQWDIGEPFNDLNGNGVRDAVEPRPTELNPPMRNVEAAAYINNITRSIAAFEDLPGSDQTVFTPGELAATQFVLIGALPRLQDPTNPTNLIPNPNFNPALQAFIRTQANNVLANFAYQSFGNSVAPVNPANSRAGKVPFRTLAADTYSDQALVPGGNAYITESGATLTYGSNLPLRNLVAGDFNGDGLRNLNDAAAIVGAWRKRHQGQAWSAPNGSGALAALAAQVGTTVPGGDFCIEIVGDFNGDGSFNAADVRYWADGLAIDPATGNLNRKLGFEAIDNAFGGNFFGTTLAAGASYQTGFSRADVAGPSGLQTPNFAPIGADGVVNAFDIDYVYRQFKQNPFVTDGEANWSDLAEAASTDLGADINGDLVINQADVDEIVLVILNTSYGDVNLDGVVCRNDLAIAHANLNTAGGWARGDMNGDGQITQADLDIIRSNICFADWNCDNVVNSSDLSALITSWLDSIQNGNLNADVNNDGAVNSSDLSAFITLWLAAVQNGC